MSEVTPGGPRVGPPWGAIAFVLVALAVPGYAMWNWFFCRLEVPPGHLAVLIAKTGTDLTGGDIIATQPGQKGIQLETLKPGRHFLNPLLWESDIKEMVEVPNGKVGVLTRLYGRTPDLSKGGENLLVARDGDLKGIVAEVLAPGVHERINPRAYDVQLYDAVEIHAGFVGVVCNQVGPDPKEPNAYLVGPGERGVQRDVLKAGTYNLNPWAVQVYPVDVRSQRLELSAAAGSKQEDAPTGDADQRAALVFPSSDGFEIEVKLTVEWSIDEERAAEVLVRIGVQAGENPMAEILHKALIPALRGNARIEGSKYPAANYIAGESRTIFQTSIYDTLKAACEDQGIIIRSVLVNDIVPPQDIARPIREREVAKEELSRNQVQLQQARAEQSLARETELVQQEQVKVESETEKEKRRIAAEGAQRVALIEQEQALAVARADVAAAELQAKAVLSRGQAEADVIAAQNRAEAEGLRASVDAFATPGGFAAFTFAQKIGPRVRTVFADPDGPFGSIFEELLAPTGSARTGGGR